MEDTTNREPYFSISTIAVKPDKIHEAYDAFEEIAKHTQDKEPGALIYRFYKVEGKNEYVWIEKFENRDAYTAHVQSDHVQEWAKKYMDAGLFEGGIEFHPLSKDGPGAGGFDRS